MRKPPIVIVIGGGLSGLTCAVRLHEEGVPVLLVESTDRLGGRALSDRFESYILDRGFQALLNAYPARARRSQHERAEFASVLSWRSDLVER